MDQLGEAAVPRWRGQILGQGSFEEPPPVPAGEALVFPVAIPSGSGTARQGQIQGPWGPIATYLECTPVEAGRPGSVTLGLEWPFTPQGISPPLTKTMAELLHVQLYVQDWWEGRGSPPFQIVEQGDRPDFQIRNYHGDFGLDVTRLTNSQRRQAQDLFAQVRSSIRRDAKSFSRLRGHVVAMWFPGGETPGIGLPPARRDGRTRDLLVRHLQQLDPRSSASHVHDVTGLPGAGTSFALMQGYHPATDFFEICGFELALVYSTSHETRDVWTEIARVALQHDYVGCHKLVISVGTPAAPHGEVTPADFLLWCVATQAGGWPTPPKLEHIRTIDIHDWWTGSINRVYPTFDLLAPPRRNGPVFPIRPAGTETEPPMGWTIAATHD